MSCVTGDETGLIKVWDITKSSGATLKFTHGEQSRKRGIVGMCWVNSATNSVAFSSADQQLSILDLESRLITANTKLSHCSALPHSMSFVKGKLLVVGKAGQFTFLDSELNTTRHFASDGVVVDACHIHRKFGMVAVGGKDCELSVFDINSAEGETPVFKAENVKDHILGVPYPVYVTGACIINPFVYCISTAYHQVRFYDRRSSNRPVQEYEVDREIERRPTTMLQWNANKYLVGETSGDIHLYDTRRGFSSRAKLRGGVGSVRCMAKHPVGHQLLAVTGLDRKARIYHVPTGKLLTSIYTKQRANCVLLDKNLPFTDNVASFSGVINAKQPEKNVLGDELWDDMDPVVDPLDEVLIRKRTKRKREDE